MVSEGGYSKKNVCVIGAGSSGLVAARELRKEGHTVVVLEQNHDIGGQWLYEPNVESGDPLGRNNNNFLNVHSSMYNSIRVQSPREVMGYTDFPFLVKEGRDKRRFPGHKEIWFYLNDFCEKFRLREMIRFNTRVKYVGMLNYGERGDDLKWVVKSRENNAENVVEEVFDAVVVATGHYSQPTLPAIKGMDAWKRKQIHSHVYRVPEPFRDEVVVIVGKSFSAQDISMELVEVAKEVYISVRSFDDVIEGFSKVISKHQNMHLFPQIESLHEDGRVQFVDGSCVIADTIIYCTGYSYTFPFLDTKGIVVVDDNRVGPLFEHTFPPSLAPSLSFVGIVRRVLGFPFFESQGKWIAQLLSGKTRLPSYDDMMQSTNQFYHSMELAGRPKSDTHYLEPHHIFEYCDKYADYSGSPHLEEWRIKLILSAVVELYANLETFRDSWSEDVDKLLQQTLQNPYFTQN